MGGPFLYAVCYIRVRELLEIQTVTYIVRRNIMHDYEWNRGFYTFRFWFQYNYTFGFRFKNDYTFGFGFQNDIHARTGNLGFPCPVTRQREYNDVARGSRYEVIAC
ncbi:MAG: hypothetical protein LIO85_03705 [Rikenellaceae bacterium]|nr:hypothetical protein [Rikenellaceae bacterium]